MSELNNPQMSDEKKTPEKAVYSAVVQTSSMQTPLVMLQFEGFNLLFPSKSVITILSSQASSLLAPVSQDECGLVEFQQQHFPIYCFNKAFQLQQSLMPSHQALVILAGDDCSFALSCCGLEKVVEGSLRFFPVPRAMSSRKQPFTEFAVINQNAVGLSSCESIIKLLQLRGVKISAIAETSHLVLQEVS